MMSSITSSEKSTQRPDISFSEIVALPSLGDTEVPSEWPKPRDTEHTPGFGGLSQSPVTSPPCIWPLLLEPPPRRTRSQTDFLAPTASLMSQVVYSREDSRWNDRGLGRPRFPPGPSTNFVQKPQHRHTWLDPLGFKRSQLSSANHDLSYLLSVTGCSSLRRKKKIENNKSLRCLQTR